MIQFYFQDDNPQETLRTKTIQRANEAALESLKTFIDEPVECYNTKETYQKFTYKTGSFRGSQTLIAEVTFIISAQDNVTATSRSSVTITCREALNVKISAPNALPRLTALLPLNISGSIVNPFLVRADEVTCCQELYGQNKDECCRTGFIQIASNCGKCFTGKLFFLTIVLRVQVFYDQMLYETKHRVDRSYKMKASSRNILHKHGQFVVTVKRF